MTKRTSNPGRPQVGARYSVGNHIDTRREAVTVINVDRQFVYALDDDKQPVRWTRAQWRRDKPERIG